MNTWVWNQIGLELSDIDVEGTIESEGCSQGRDNLGDNSVEICVGWSLNVKRSAANIINGLIVKHHCNIGVFEKGMSCQDSVVWLNDGSGHLGRWVHGEAEL